MHDPRPSFSTCAGEQNSRVTSDNRNHRITVAAHNTVTVRVMITGTVTVRAFFRPGHNHIHYQSHLC